jgi:acyl carrier protein
MKDRIIRLIAQAKNDATIPDRLIESSHLVNDLGLDSLQLINLILLIEDEFAVEVDFDSFQVEHLSSLERFTDYVAALPRS